MISVVITMQVEFCPMLLSPVIRPTSPSNSSPSSRNFWFDSAFRGDVYTTLWLSLKAIAMAYSATAVLPALVWAATITFSRRSKQATDFS